MKKVCSAGIFLMLLVILAAVNYKTAYGEENEFNYSYSWEGEDQSQAVAYIFGYNGQEENLVIPDEIEGYKVVSVEFYGQENTYVKTITLPSGITEAGGFETFTSLTDIYVSEGNEEFFSEDGLLYYKKQNILASVPCARKGPVSVKEGTEIIGNDAFSKCKYITEVNIPSSVKTIGGAAFALCGSEALDIRIDENNQYISLKDGMLCDKAGEALYVCLPSDSDTVTVPQYIKRICSMAFSSSANAKKIIVPSGDIILDRGAFMDCLAQEIVLPEGIKAIPPYAFMWCMDLVNVNIPSTVTNIGERAFCYCLGLGKITIPENVDTIEECAFMGAQPKDVYVESRNIKYIGDRAFNFFTDATNVYVHGEKMYNLIDAQKEYSDGFNLILIKDAEPLELDKHDVTLYTGSASKSVKVKAVLTGIKGKVKWSTSDKSVATVKDGKITAVKKGNAVVTASVSGHKKKVRVTVKNPQILIIDGSEKINTVKVKKGKTAYFRVSVNPSKSGIKAVIGKSSKKLAKITVKNGILSVKGIKKGTFTFKLKSGKGTKTVKARVA